MPRLFFEKDKVPCPNELKEQVTAQMQEKAHLFAASNINTLDGLRLEFGDSWMLIRASGTEPAIRVIAESLSKSRTDELIDKGTKLVQSLVEASR
jgi:phosphomannomutase